jgi:predicted porin
MTDLRSFLAALTLTLPVLAAAQTPATPEAAPPATAPATPPAEKPAPPPPPLAQIYGTLNVNLQYTEAAGATAPNSNVKPRFAVSIDSSNIGVRGTLKLTEMYSAVYQCETGANIDGEAGAVLCNRNSRVGLSSFWGTLAYGNWDMPMKSGTYGTKADDPFGNTDVYGFNGLMGSPGWSVRSVSLNQAAPAATGVASFDNRGGNSAIYWSPKFGPVSLRLQWGTDEFRSNTGTVDPTLLGGVVNVDMGPFSVVGEVEYHEDYYGIRVVNAANATAANTTNAAGKDLGWRLAAGYDLPLGVGVLNVMGMVEQLDFKQDDAAGAGAIKDYSRMAWLLGAKLRVGPHEFRARYSQALKPSMTAATGQTLAANAEDQLGAQNYAVGYSYSLAKTTFVYLFWTQMMNEDRARYTFGVSGNAAVVAMGAAQAGADPMAAGLGIRHAF